MQRYKVIDVTDGIVKVEDRLGVKDRHGKFPTVDYYVNSKGLEKGDWVDIVVRLQSRPEKKE